MPSTASVLLGAGCSILGAWIVASRGQGTRAAAWSGLVPALAASAGFGAPAIAPLALFVLGAGALTRRGRERKESLGAAERNEGRRGVVNVAAKLTLPAFLGAVAAAFPAHAPLCAAGYAAGLAGAFADTAATEVGPLAKGGAFALGRGVARGVPHGTPGAVSVAGIAASAGAAGATAAVAAAAGLLPWGTAGIAAGCGFGASFLESLAAATAAGRRLGHHGRNAALSLLATGTALALVGSRLP